MKVGENDAARRPSRSDNASGRLFPPVYTPVTLPFCPRAYLAPRSNGTGARPDPPDPPDPSLTPHGGPMRLDANDGLIALCRGVIALALAPLTANGASAQLLFDGNIFWQNNNTGTLAAQLSGAATAGGACAGLTAATLGTTTFPHNSYVDPLLSGAINVTNVR